ncbi:Alpha-1,2-mannosyltransferase MNN23 [Symbiodinium microadriaticum]|uniref:Alpha-1,2-mannosyltransferase MNN23 n=1 Tax=Symbiodinium microadriaticum TaxID=2951 RepID=A0A1Q9DNP1_SYMMI|nr:Alpha-1,2-mannosyltransferase MNN23 [Symbiodinium microadriaticum]
MAVGVLCASIPKARDNFHGSTMHELMDGLDEGWMDGWTDGRREGWMDGPGARIDLSMLNPTEVAGRGIVICAGGPYLPLAWLSVRLLRKHCGCQLPVELWHLPNEVPDSWRRQLDGESGVCLRELPELPRKRPEVWAVKPLALLGCSFAEILLLDADNLPLSSPDALFSEPLYREHGAVFWKDFGVFEDEPTLYLWDQKGYARLKQISARLMHA